MLVYVICYGAAMLFAFSAHFTLSGMSLLLAAVYLYLREYGKSGNPLHLRGLFSLFYVGGEGISCLKLSRLQRMVMFRKNVCRADLRRQLPQNTGIIFL